MSPININDIFNNLIIINANQLDEFADDLESTFKSLAKEKDVDHLKVLRNKLQTTLEIESRKLSEKEKKDLRRIHEILEDMSEVIESIESENEKDIVLVDVVKKLQKKNTPLTALPDNKKSTHVLVAKRKEEISYEEAMLPLQLELVKLQRYIQESGKRVLVIFEGRDAAGKWGNIKRFMENLNPRSAKVVALVKPTEVEKGQWYFQRYLKHLPNAGEIVFFDRSWYNRAGVEPVMGFVNETDYETFLEQAPILEKMLVESGIQIIKYYFSVSKEEQAARFEERRTNPLKQYKLSPIDQFSQKLWDRYSIAEYANFSHTHTEYAPWTIVHSDDKEGSRLNAIKYLLSQFDYPDKAPAKNLKVDRKMVETGKERLETLKKEIDTNTSLFD